MFVVYCPIFYIDTLAFRIGWKKGVLKRWGLEFGAGFHSEEGDRRERVA